MKTRKKENKKTLLKGEGINQHTLYGNFKTEDTISEFADVIVEEDSLLKHEQPNGAFAEHQTLKIETGVWKMGRQVEYNPFKREITIIWD